MIRLLDSSDRDSAARATWLIRQREQPAFRQMLFDQLFTWPTDQPRHATDTYGDPVKSNRPLLVPCDCSLESLARTTRAFAAPNPIGNADSVNRHKPPGLGPNPLIQRKCPVPRPVASIRVPKSFLHSALKWDNFQDAELVPPRTFGPDSSRL